ncbi:MAG TPA: dTDP-4-dehydrorhamnose reductase [Burkholderiaceae bacterium]|nr:dTDP-4-dehydrorhamnose reductase [Burkholderiaceae bacterium]
MKLLVFGASGQVGWELQRALQPLGEVVALQRNAAGNAWHADFAQPEALARTIEAIRPDVIVNAAAYTAVDQAESEPALAEAVNARAPAVLARAAAAHGAWLVHYSTDYVFDGSGDMARDEEAPVQPLSAYGRTKLAGEQAIRASGCRHLLLRTSWVYGARGGNFAKTMLKLAATRERLAVVDDQVGAPTGAELLADVTAHAILAARSDPTLSGLYHVAPTGETTWHDYAVFVFAEARRRGAHLALAADGLTRIATRDYKTAAARPLNSRLDTRRFRERFHLTLPPWQTGVARLLDEIALP